MNPVRRWFKFNVVGVAGMLVQLVTLAGLNHIVPRHYLVNSLVAVETAILHNFVAHVHYTWRDRILHHPWRGQIVRSAWRDRHKSMVLLRPLFRFQVSNGAVSLLGNAVLMKLLVARAHLAVLVANLVAIAVCGLANFWLGDSWAFARRAARKSKRLCWSGVALVLIVMQVGMAVGQETAPAAQQPANPVIQQQPPALSPAAQNVNDAVVKIGEDGKITVHMLNGVVYHGRVGSMEADRFTVHEVDLAQTVPIRYDEVRSVKVNYGGRGFGGRRTDPMHQLLITAIVVAGLLGAVILAVTSDKS